MGVQEEELNYFLQLRQQLATTHLRAFIPCSLPNITVSRKVNITTRT